MDWGYSRDHAIRKICPSLHIAKSTTSFIIVTLLYSNKKYLYLCAKLLPYCFTNHHYLHEIKLFASLSLLLISYMEPNSMYSVCPYNVSPLVSKINIACIKITNQYSPIVSLN
jgi:hypothetical protein